MFLAGANSIFNGDKRLDDAEPRVRLRRGAVPVAGAGLKPNPRLEHKAEGGTRRRRLGLCPGTNIAFKNSISARHVG